MTDGLYSPTSQNSVHLCLFLFFSLFLLLSFCFVVSSFPFCWPILFFLTKSALFMNLRRFFLFLFLLTSLLLYLFSLFFSVTDQHALPFLKELEEVIDREDQAEEENDEVSDHVELVLEVPDPHVDHHEGPGQNQGSHHVDELTIDDLPLLASHQLPQEVVFSQAGGQELKGKDETNVDSHEDEGTQVGGNEVRGNPKEEPFLSGDSFIAEGPHLRHFESEEVEHVLVDLLVTEGKIPEENLGQREV